MGTNIIKGQNEDRCSQNEYTPSQNDEHSITSIIKENNKEIEGKPSIPAKLDILKHPRNFKREILTDELNSIGELEEKAELEKQKRKERKKTLYQKCLDAIDNPAYNFRDDVKQSLRDFLPSTLQANEYAVKGINQWKYRLQTLIQLSTNPDTQLKIISQSLSNSMTGFKSLKSKQSYSSHDEVNIQYQTLSAEEAEALLAKETEEYGTI